MTAQALRAPILAEAPNRLARAHERKRIAREIHDGLGHDLALLSIFTTAIETPELLSLDEIRSAAKVICQGVTRAQADLRRILTATETIGREPLTESLDEMFRRVGEAGRSVRASVDSRIGLLELDAQETIERFCLEGLTNALKYAAPGEIGVTIRLLATRGVTMTVRSPLATAASRDSKASAGTGISGLRDDALLLGGRVTVHVGGGNFYLRGSLPAR